tara:strand:- start:3221 stop:3601 length:381 start_codon:yes stop_codon:yes gene_type:complete
MTGCTYSRTISKANKKGKCRTQRQHQAHLNGKARKVGCTHSRSVGVAGRKGKCRSKQEHDRLSKRHRERVRAKSLVKLANAVTVKRRYIDEKKRNIDDLALNDPYGDYVPFRQAPSYGRGSRAPRG